MALFKEVQSSIGVTLSYWRIKDFAFNNVDKRGYIVIVPYVSKTTRDAGNDYVQEETRKISIFDLDYSGHDGYEENTVLNYTDYFEPNKIANTENFYSTMYRYIKENVPDFIDAEDI